MSTSAILMMLVAIAVLWGGLALAIANLNRSKDTPTQEEVHRDL